MAAAGDGEGAPMGTHRIDYAGSVHDEREVEAVVEVLRGGPTALRIGRNVREMERRVAELLGKRRGVMCNSGSSALYLAIEVLDLAPGDEIVTSAVTFSTDLAPMVRSGIVPAFVDVTPDTFQIDVDGIEEMIGPRTRAILAPDLIGNAPDWDVIRAIADRHGLVVVEDSCDALGQTLRGTPTGSRADISLTSFALSHIITAAGTGGMVCFDDDDLVDRALLLRRWGRRSEVQLFGSTKGVDRRFFSTIDGAGGAADIEYDNLFIFDEAGWNFEPSELSAAFGLVQLDKLPQNLARRRRSFKVTRAHVARHEDLFVLPRVTDGVETAWHMFPFLIRPSSGIRRAELQAWMESHGIDTRMVWTGNATRQPAFRDTPFRVPDAGLPNADVVMERGLILPNSHSLTDEDCEWIGRCLDGFVATLGSRPGGPGDR
ncbi:DegT/DnrJ/EryC1/StrS family aminotransferase [Dermatobacter hominis]|uniref:DegT/DnrJ/EryC1/StrS family aminotransferase n=1 Tax=Dermatobacter hominis TaxID=2884263 RepID=UPI001D11E707|nr:DegT/DnrJ/EryC1/StrS family aminotransferase [Dermatobacter hominis]UDY37440.1 DegT/DnrJ/EryC1/StrS family aminotransferase [Dermatobacter hominis]